LLDAVVQRGLCRSPRSEKGLLVCWQHRGTAF